MHKRRSRGMNTLRPFAEVKQGTETGRIAPGTLSYEEAVPGTGGPAAISATDLLRRE